MPITTATLSAWTLAKAASGGALAGLGILAALSTTGLVPAPRAPMAAAQKVAPAPRIAKPVAPAADPNAYVIKTALVLDGPLRHGDYVWRDDGAPAGPILVTVDLAAETMSVFRAGHEIGVAVISFGANDKPTPLGAFAITQKDADHHSTIYDNAPMPYMLRLTNDGITIHGSQVGREWATNGCIGVPTSFAKLLFDQVKLGDPVLITKGRQLKVGESASAA